MDRYTRRYFRAWVALGLTLIAAVGITACGSSGDSSTTASEAATTKSATTATTQPAAYDGPESKLPSSLPDPTPKQGFKYKVGILMTTTAQPALLATIAGVKAETEKLGGTVVGPLDAQLNPNTQASQLDQLITQGVDAIILNPVDPTALAPGIAKAQADGIKIVTQDSPPTAGEALQDGVSADFLEGRDTAVAGLAAAAAEADPGGTFATIGLGIPIPILQYSVKRQAYWAERLGMTNAGDVDIKEDTSGAAAEALNTIVAQNPDISTVFCYNDQCGQAVAQAAKANGKDIKVWGQNGEPAAFESIKADRLYGTWNANFYEVGRQMSIGVYDLLTDQNLPLAKQYAVGGEVVTAENVDSASALGIDRSGANG
jgi:ABC-type sugar transport system substrate-binding protein